MKNRSAVLYGASGALALAVILAYLNVIHGELQFDDEEFINESLAGFSPTSLLSRESLAGIISGQRLLTLLTFAFNYHIAGLAVSGFHIFNILLHAAAAILAFHFLLSLSTLAPDNRLSKSSPILPALCAAMIFALHPLQTQAVSYIVQRAEVLASIFYLSSLMSLLNFIRTSGSKSYFWWMAGLVFFIAGWISKEIIITVPLAYLLCIFYAGDRSQIKRAFHGIVPYLSGGIVLGFIKLMSLTGARSAGFSSFEPGVASYAMTQMKVVAKYFLLFLIPAGQNIDHDVIPVTSLLNPEGLLLTCLWILMPAGCLFILIHRRGGKSDDLRSAAFGIIWAIVLLLPTSSIIPIADPMYEHRMYLALLGLSLTAVSLVRTVAEKLLPSVRNMALTALVLTIFICLGFMVHERNKIWLTKESLWLDATRKSPQKSRPFNNLGNCYLLNRQYQSASDHYRKAISLDPKNINAYHNLALALKNMGQTAEAVRFYMKYVELSEEGGRANK